MAEERLLMGEIVAAHGIKGLIKVRSFTEVAGNILGYGPLCDGAGRMVALSLRGAVKGGLLAAIPGVNDRNGAEALKGTKLYIERTALPDLPAGEEQYYHADLIGLAVELPAGVAFGRIEAMHDFGAGDLLEVRPAGSNQTIMVPFNRTAVPRIDLAGGRVVIAAPNSENDPLAANANDRDDQDDRDG